MTVSKVSKWDWNQDHVNGLKTRLRKVRLRPWLCQRYQPKRYMWYWWTPCEHWNGQGWYVFWGECINVCNIFHFCYSCEWEFMDECMRIYFFHFCWNKSTRTNENAWMTTQDSIFHENAWMKAWDSISLFPFFLHFLHLELVVSFTIIEFLWYQNFVLFLKMRDVCKSWS